MINDVEHEQESELITQSEDEMAVMKYLLTQYNLKAGLKHVGEKGIAAAKGDLTQFHVIYIWVPKDPTMLSRSEKVKTLSSLLLSFRNMRDDRAFKLSAFDSMVGSSGYQVSITWS